MQTGRFILAVVLMVAVIVVTNILFPPLPPEQLTEAEEVTVGEVAEAPVESEVPPPPIAAEPVVPATIDTVVVQSPLYRYAISTAGGSVVGAELLRYESYSEGSDVVDLVQEGAGPLVSYRLRVGDRIVDLSTLVFHVEREAPLRVDVEDEAEILSLVHSDPAGGFTVRLHYRFLPDSYLIDVRGEVEGVANARTVLLNLGPTLAVHEANPEEDARALAVVTRDRRERIESVPLSRVSSDRVIDGPLSWVALKNKYFLAAAVIAGEEGAAPFGGAIATPAEGEDAADIGITLPISGDEFAFRLYLGPQEPNRLAAVGLGLEDVNPYGWRILRPIIRPLGHLITWALVSLHGLLGIGYGWVLIIFGVLIRLMLWPLNARAGRAQLKNMALQPRIQEIQQKYKDQPEKLQAEMARLIREEGFNPFGGCLPMLIPFPVLITLFFVFQNTIEFRGVEFLWLPDLSQPDPLYILPILLGLSMFGMQWISMRAMPPNPQTKMMMYFMPIFMVIIFFRLASGLNLYYFAQNVASIPQQIQLTKERMRAQEAQRR